MEKGKGKREKGEGRREKGEGRREKGEGRREKGEGRRDTHFRCTQRAPASAVMAADFKKGTHAARRAWNRNLE